MLRGGPCATRLPFRHIARQRSGHQRTQQLSDAQQWGKALGVGQDGAQHAPHYLFHPRTFHQFFRSSAAYVGQLSILHTGRARRFASAASQAAIQMQLCGAAGAVGLQHIFDQINSSARAVQFIAQQLICGAGGVAKAAVHTTAQDAICLLTGGCFLERR